MRSQLHCQLARAKPRALLRVIELNGNQSEASLLSSSNSILMSSNDPPIRFNLQLLLAFARSATQQAFVAHCHSKDDENREGSHFRDGEGVLTNFPYSRPQLLVRVKRTMTTRARSWAVDKDTAEWLEICTGAMM
jgi:hypothetical protein